MTPTDADTGAEAFSPASFSSLGPDPFEAR